MADYPDQPVPLLILVAPHGERVASGEKTLVVKSRRFSGLTRLPLYVVQDEAIRARIVLMSPFEIDLERFRDLRDAHTVTEEEREEWWPGKGTLYAYGFQLLESFDPPIEVEYPPGPQVSVDHYRFVGERPKGIHRTKLSDIEDFEDYRPQDVEDEQALRDDWRILAAHWAKLERGEETPWSRSQVFLDAVKLAEELVERDAIVFHPEKMEGTSRELYREVKRELDARGVHLPHALTEGELEAVQPPFDDLADRELEGLHRDLHHTWEDRDLNEETIYNAHRLVLGEIEERGLEHEVESTLDRELKESTDPGLDPDRFVPVVVTHDALSLAGSSVYGVRANDVDWILRSLDYDLIEPIRVALEALFPGEHHVTTDPLGANWNHVPVGDLVLVPRRLEDQQMEYSVAEVPEEFQFLADVEPFAVDDEVLAVASDGKLESKISLSAGIILKLERIWHDEAVEVEIVDEFSQDAIPVADLFFVPYEELELVELREPEFEEVALDFWRSANQVLMEADLSPGEAFAPPKSSKGYHEAEWTETDSLWKYWAEGYVDRGIVVEEKFDGVRLSLHSSSDGTVDVFTEDEERDRADVFPAIVEEIRGLPCDSVILDCEFVWYSGGDPKQRWEMAAFVTQKEPFSADEDIRVFVHDVPYLDGEDWTDRGTLERIEKVHELLPSDLTYLRPAEYRVVDDRQSMDEAIEWAANRPGSEGAMLKVADAPYVVNGEPPRTPLWAKFKVAMELSLQVIARSRKAQPWENAGLEVPSDPLAGSEAGEKYERLAQESTTWRYHVAVRSDSGLKPVEAASTLAPADVHLRWVIPGQEDPFTGNMVSGERPEWRGVDDPAIWEFGDEFEAREVGDRQYGTTYTTGIDAEIGDVITVAPQQMRYVEEGDFFSFVFPRVKELDPTKREPDTVEDAMEVVEKTRARMEAAAGALIRESSSWRQPPWSSPGSKYFLAPTVVDLLPGHETYVEPFAGAAAVLFAKPSSAVEVISDLDRELIHAFKDVKALSMDELYALHHEKEWTPSRDRFERLQASEEPDDRLDRLYRFLYVSWFSYGSKRRKEAGGTYRRPSNFSLDNRMERVVRAHFRLERVKIYTQPAVDVVEKFDSDETVFYFDPPYPTASHESEPIWGSYTMEDFEELVDRLEDVEGKFVLSMDDDPDVREILGSFEVRSIDVGKGLQHADGSASREELLVANFSLPRSIEAGSPLLAQQVEPEEVLPKGEEEELTHEEQRKRAEERLGDWYLLSQPSGETFPSMLQYHIRGVYHPDQLEELRAQLKGVESQEELDEVWSEWDDLVWTDDDFDEISEDAQAADDERGDVSGAIHGHFSDDPPPFDRLAELYPKMGNVGNVHVDWRQPHPDMRYLAGSWTNDVPKVAFQSLEDEVTYFVRDRIVRNESGDQWLCQKKCPGSIDPDEDELLPYILREDAIVERAYETAADLGLPTIWEAIQPMVWLNLVTADDPVLDVQPGEIGATKATAARFVWLGRTEMCYGVRKSDYYESFHFFESHNVDLFGELDYGTLDGRWDVKEIPGREEYEKAPEEEFWMGSKPWTEEGKLPYVLTHDLEEEIEKAEEDEIEMIWNETAIPILQELGYVDEAGHLTETYQES